MDLELKAELQKLSEFYRSGATMSADFRMEKLKKLKEAIYEYEKELHEALYTDLKKSPEESWITETGMTIAGISHTLKNLKKWMRPEKVPTNLLNLPSRSFIYKEPLGVVLIIGPWNYPLQLLFMPLIGAIAAGNCAVLKPSEFAPATSRVMRNIIEKYFSKDHILFVEGEGDKIVPSLIRSFNFNHIFYTGSTQVGREVYKMAAEKLVPVTLELGGKSPCVVESDANIKVAAKRIAVTKFSNAGQMCVAPDYVLAHESVKDQLVAELIVNIKSFYSEDPSNDYHYGKIINEKQFRRLIDYLDHGRVVYGGGHDDTKHFIEPTIMEDVDIETAVMGEEIFGPLLPVISFKTFEEAKSIIDKNPDPLAFYVFTQSSEKEKQWLRSVHFGGGCVNNASWHLTNFDLPFGGRGNSGIGAYHGKYSFDLFSHSKAVMKTPTWFDPKLKYPPFEGKLSFFKKIIR
jgi:aldehyde dehydrogenase (NAD+)